VRSWEYLRGVSVYLFMVNPSSTMHSQITLTFTYHSVHSILSQRSHTRIRQSLTRVLRSGEQEEEDASESGGEGHGVLATTELPATFPAGDLDEVAGDHGSGDTEDRDDGVLAVIRSRRLSERDYLRGEEGRKNVPVSVVDAI
jgi:hypothetical protein